MAGQTEHRIYFSHFQSPSFISHFSRFAVVVHVWYTCALHLLLLLSPCHSHTYSSSIRHQRHRTKFPRCRCPPPPPALRTCRPVHPAKCVLGRCSMLLHLPSSPSMHPSSSSSSEHASFPFLLRVRVRSSFGPASDCPLCSEIYSSEKEMLTPSKVNEKNARGLLRFVSGLSSGLWAERG